MFTYTQSPHTQPPIAITSINFLNYRFNCFLVLMWASWTLTSLLPSFEHREHPAFPSWLLLNWLSYLYFEGRMLSVLQTSSGEFSIATHEDMLLQSPPFALHLTNLNSQSLHPPTDSSPTACVWFYLSLSPSCLHA